MEFPKEFFLDEVREGFYVPAMMKRAWAAEIEILFEIDKICEKHELHYCIDYGNLLGAIRHRGFIPWFVTSEIDIENPEDGKAIVNAENYIVMPALVHADYAILQSEMIVKLYKGILEKESGIEYAKYWEDKLLPLGIPLSDERPIEENSVAKKIWSHLRKMIME